MHRSAIRLAALTALAVAALPAAASASTGDRDHDGMPDRWEQRHHVRSADADPDRDRLVNAFEFAAGTKPRDADSDDDRVRDPREDGDHDGLVNVVEARFDLDPKSDDTDDDGVEDAEEGAGAILSFEDGVLTLRLAGGGSVTAAVDEHTDVLCRDERRDEDEDEDEDHDEQDADDDDRVLARAATDDGGGSEKFCDADELVAGRIVREAELKLSSGALRFRKIKVVIAEEVNPAA